MSFILDRLKKSGEKRRIELLLNKQSEGSAAMQETVSGSTAGSMPVQKPKIINVRSVLFLVILASILVHAFFVLWQKPRVQTEKTISSSGLSHGTGDIGTTDRIEESHLSPTIAKVPAKEHVQVIEKTDNKISRIKTQNSEEQKMTKQPPQLQHREEDARRENVKKIVLKEQKIGNNIIPAEKIHPHPEQNKVIDTPVAESMSKADNEAEKGQKIVDFNELPQAIRKGMPAIKITSHLYKKDSGLVNINGRIMTGDNNLENGVYLEKIIPEGVILSYQGYRFRMKAE